MAKILEAGDGVAWDTGHGDSRTKGHKVVALNDPRSIVESGKSGKRAAHNPGEPRRRS